MTSTKRKSSNDSSAIEASPKRRRRWPKAVAAIAIAVGVGVAISGCDDKSEPAKKDKPATAEEASKSTGPKTAEDDVTDVKIVADESRLASLAEVSATITNNTDEKSDYYVDVVVESADGKTKLTTSTIMATDIEPGQTTTETSILTEEVPADAVAKVESVQRTPSLG